MIISLQYIQIIIKKLLLIYEFVDFMIIQRNHKNI